MTSMRFAKVDYKYLLFSEIYTRFDEPKSVRKAFALLEAAIGCYSRKGFDSVTMQMIAREAGVSRTLLSHYFESANEVRDLSIRYIRLLFQKIAIQAIEKPEAIEEKLREYVRSCFYWSNNFRAHALVWLAFLHRCSSDTKLRALNTAAGAVGADRISGLIDAGRSQGIFFAVDSHAAAREIQAVVAGGLILAISENLPDEAAFAESIVERCLTIAIGR